MKRHLQVFLAGALVLVPFAITAYVILALAAWLGSLGMGLLKNTGILDTLEAVGVPQWIIYKNTWVNGVRVEEPSGLVYVLGAIIVLAAVYGAGLMTHSRLFPRLLTMVESWITRVPGLKTVYESVRDLMKLFGSDGKKMGRAVLYHVPNTEVSVLGILTNENPAGTGTDKRDLVAVYLPFSYMFGGPTIFVERSHVQDAGIPVEQALKLCATAHVTRQEPDDKAATPAGTSKPPQ